MRYILLLTRTKQNWNETFPSTKNSTSSIRNYLAQSVFPILILNHIDQLLSCLFCCCCCCFIRNIRIMRRERKAKQADITSSPVSWCGWQTTHIYVSLSKIHPLCLGLVKRNCIPCDTMSTSISLLLLFLFLGKKDEKKTNKQKDDDDEREESRTLSFWDTFPNWPLWIHIHWKSLSAFFLVVKVKLSHISYCSTFFKYNTKNSSLSHSSTSNSIRI